MTKKHKTQEDIWQAEIHAHQDDMGYFDEPWYLGMEPTQRDYAQMADDYLYDNWSTGNHKNIRVDKLA